MAWFIEVPVAGFKLPVPDQLSRPSMSLRGRTKIRPLYSTSLAMGERYYIRLRPGHDVRDRLGTSGSAKIDVCNTSLLLPRLDHFTKMRTTMGSDSSVTETSVRQSRGTFRNRIRLTSVVVASLSASKRTVKDHAYGSARGQNPI